MKILYFVSNDGGNGVGGHYNSLHQVSQEMAKGHEVKIITLGTNSSPILQQNPFFENHISLANGLKSLKKLNAELKTIYKTFKPDIIHCFDTNSLNRVLLLPITKDQPIVLNKCGGRDPLRSNYQHANAIVVFSKENQDWFFNSSNYSNKEIFLIPNRVRKLVKLPFNKQEEKAKPDTTTFVRVSRLGGAYEMTLLQTYNLIEKLGKSFPVELVVVGRVQDESRFNKLVETARSRNLPVRFITDERAARGSDFLYLADFVVGTGRSFMEATSLGIPSLTPAANSEDPILVTNRNFQNFLNTNFSERNISDNESLDTNFSSIELLMTNREKYQEAKNETKKLFDNYFGTEAIFDKYNKVYNSVLNNGSRRGTLIRKNLLYLFKFIFSRN